ncbi:hypothetical protein [Streptomyces sp. UNOB3_S3]|uniref:hypothetical protein n=1 Tax=Streptomyces sp. UNOB3_S3 TaxID=2871682 RepID=UPI001E2A13C2|nr:hypothetical protein [Streptomyces sp. UNOB3_S3]MCC3775121.1 hypothetical protein [Streptomyces sp. UNOB3_S3]
MAVRTATTTGWLLRGNDGRLTAFAPVSGGLLRWTEARPGGPEWTGPQRLDVPGLEPYLSIAQSAEGYVYLAGLRRRPHDDGRAETDVVYATQFQPGRAMTQWRSIGTPHGTDWEKAGRIGFPVAAVDGVGLHLYFRNAGRGVSGRRQDARGIWGPWLDLAGNKVAESGSAAVSADGYVELVAPAPDHVLRWRQEEAGGPLKRMPDTAVKSLPGSFSSASAGSGGGLAHYWRTEGDSVLHVQRADESRALPSLGGDASGPVAVLGDVLAQRSDEGRVVVAVGEDGSWSDTGQECVGAPALARDAEGRVVVAAVGPDGGLWVARQRGAGTGLELGPWVRA